MMLIVTSKAYLYCNYALIKRIHSDDANEEIEGMIDTLEGMSYQDIFNLFMDRDDLAYLLIEAFYYYYDLTYVGESQCKEYVFENKDKLKCLLKFNPFEVFEIFKFISKNDLLQSEIIIQDFFDIYEEVFNGSCSDEDSEDSEIDNIDNIECEAYERFLSMLNDKYSEEYVNNFLLYMCGNVYETLSISEKNLKDENAKALVDYFLETSSSAVLHDLKTDYSFANIVIKYFYDNNMYISREELSKRRYKFKKRNKNLTIIRDLNPYFDSEEKLFKRKKSHQL